MESAKKKGRLDALERRLSSAGTLFPTPAPDSRSPIRPHFKGPRSDGDDALYAGVCESVLRGPQSAVLRGEGDVHSFLVDVLTANAQFEGDVSGTIETRTRDAVLLLDSRSGGGGRRRGRLAREQRRFAKRLSRRRHRALGSFDLPPEARKHALYGELHAMWSSYAEGLLAGCDEAALFSRVLALDLHGAVLAVVESKNPSFVGTQGIVVRETAATFALVTPADKLAVVPKEGSIFRLAVQSRVVTLFGSNLGAQSRAPVGAT